MGLSAQAERGGLPGVMFLHPEAGASLATYGISQYGTEFRAYPALDPQSGQPLPLRYGTNLDNMQIGDWICSDYYGIVMKGGGEGKEKISLLVDIVGDKGKHPSQRRGLTLWNHFRNKIYFMAESGQRANWAPLVKPGKDSPLGPRGSSKPHLLSFFFGACTLQGTATGGIRGVSRKTPNWRSVFYAKSAAQVGLRKLLFEMNPGAEQFGADWDKVYKYNYILDLQRGPLITLKKPGWDTGTGAHSAPAPVSFGSHAAASALGGQHSGDEITRELDFVVDTAPVAIPLGFIQSVVRPWDSILQVWEDEHALVCALEQGFDDEVIMDVFQDTPQFMSSRLQERLHRLRQPVVRGVPSAPPVQAPPVATADPFAPVATVSWSVGGGTTSQAPASPAMPRSPVAPDPFAPVSPAPLAPGLGEAPPWVTPPGAAPIAGSSNDPFAGAIPADVDAMAAALSRAAAPRT